MRRKATLRASCHMRSDDTNPKDMPPHFFWRTLGMDYSTAIRANIAVQDYSVRPRHWYIDARFRCVECGTEFVRSAQEQRTWFEVYRFWVDSHPRLCPACSAKRRNALHLQQEYDALVAAARAHGTPEQKQRIVEIVEALEIHFGSLPERVSETRTLFQMQLAKHHSK